MGHARFTFDYVQVVVAPWNVSALNGTAGIVHRATRLDMTRALSTAAAVVSSPPFIQTTTEAIKIYLIIVSVVCGAFALMCFASILYHRKHPVMTLSQGSFLAALVAACFVQIVFVFTYLPTQNIYCTLAGPLELIPMHVGGSILVARVWRAYSALGMAALIGRQGNNGAPSSSLSPSRPRSSRRTFELLERCHLGKKYIQCLSWLARLPLRCLGRHHSDPMRHTIRKKVTAAETASLAAVLSFPQVFLQVFGAAYYHRGLELVRQHRAVPLPVVRAVGRPGGDRPGRPGVHWRRCGGLDRPAAPVRVQREEPGVSRLVRELPHRLYHLAPAGAYQRSHRQPRCPGASFEAQSSKNLAARSLLTMACSPLVPLSRCSFALSCPSESP
jgi:7 transmembrane sweet-taste receptor of 3 GCPR